MGTICETCKLGHDGTYASGRFCSLKCANTRIYSDSKRLEIYKKISTKLAGRPNKNKGIERVHRVKIACPCGQIMSLTPCYLKRKYCSKNCKAQFADWSTASKNAFKRGTRTCNGGKTKWLKYKNILVQGTYELRTCSILDNLLTSSKILHWEYTNDRIPYKWDDNSEHMYLFDFKVTDCDNHTFYIETKGFVRENDEKKWAAAQDLNIDLRIWFNEDITKYENQINDCSDS